MKLAKARVTGALLLGLLAASCTPLKLFNAIVPKDADARPVARDAAFGSDPRQRLDVYASSNPASQHLPIIVFFYGGSWSSGTKSGYSFVGRALAARGFVVAIPDYRLVPEIRYPAFLEDNAAAVRWVRQHASEFGGDSDRVILAGHSAGAYNAAMLALDPRWLGEDRHYVRALVGLAGPYDFLPFSGAIVQRAFGGMADPPSTQPINYVRTGNPPAFLATGDKDQTVLPRNSDALARRLNADGVMVDRKRYAGLGHVGLITAFAKPLRGRGSVLDDLDAFLKRTVP